MRLFLILLTSCVLPVMAATNMTDFAAISAGWGDTHDLNDLRELAADWLDYDPNAFDGTAQGRNNDLVTVQLSAEFTTVYEVNSLPAYGDLFDYYNWGRVGRLPGSIKRNRKEFTKITAARMPYRIKRGSSTIYYYSDDPNTLDSFTWAATKDGRRDVATVTITTAPVDANSLYGDRDGYFEVDDHSALDFGNDFTLAFWIRPLVRYGTILKKRGSGPGLKLSIRAGHLVLEAWNAGGGYGKTTAFKPVTIGQWQHITMTVGHADASENMLYLDAEVVASLSDFPDPPYTNAEPLHVGGFTGQVDKLTWFPAYESVKVYTHYYEGRHAYSGFMSPQDWTAQIRLDADPDPNGVFTVDEPNTLHFTPVKMSRHPDNRPRKKY